jgi:DNA polymerase I
MICEDATADDVAQFVHEQIQRLQKRKVTLSEIGIPEGIGKNLDNYSKPTHAVRAAKYGNLLLGTTFNKNSKPKRYYIDDVDNKFFERMEDERGLDPTEDQLYRKVREDGSPRFLAVERAEQLPPEAQINWGYHESKNLKQTLSAITSAFGLEWSELQESSTQTGLDAFGD